MSIEKREKLEAQIKSVDMTEDMQQEAIEVATEAMDKFHIEKDIAQYIKKEFDSRKGATWHCIVGRNFGSFVTHEFSSRLEGYEQTRAFCQNCGNWDVHCETRWPWFTVCFVPCIPLSGKYKEAHCYRCGFTQDMRARPDITPTTQPPPGLSWGPAYGPPPGVMQYPGPMQPPPAAAQGPPVSSGGNPDAGQVYK
ncbi:Dynein light chain, cytoplasmic [Talaromyces islandicus]|uniref:Dynein light chain 1, cytoplasmic n=1 Tax=Talaromyces islandicus TaxID=28573 RepID=A0A0U1M5N7_TALIS|nr:Dynein light chain, cytoplasmic [Talaromyces islandicus]